MWHYSPCRGACLSFWFVVFVFDFIKEHWCLRNFLLLVFWATVLYQSVKQSNWCMCSDQKLVSFHSSLLQKLLWRLSSGHQKKCAILFINRFNFHLFHFLSFYFGHQCIWYFCVRFQVWLYIAWAVFFIQNSPIPLQNIQWNRWYIHLAEILFEPTQIKGERNRVMSMVSTQQDSLRKCIKKTAANS